MKHLDCLAHAGLGKGSPAEDLDGFIRNLMSTSRSKHLQQSNGARKVDGLLLIWHESHLVSDVFQPGLVGLAVCDHLCESRTLRS